MYRGEKMYKIYKVEEGDTLDSIAQKFGTTADTIRKINGLNEEDAIHNNQYIIVPVQRGVLFDLYVVQPGDTMYGIAQKYGVRESDLLKLNGLKPNEYIYPNEEILVPRKGVEFYITEEGDTMASAASKLQVTPGQILLQNETVYLLPEQLLVVKKDQTEG